MHYWSPGSFSRNSRERDTSPPFRNPTLCVWLVHVRERAPAAISESTALARTWTSLPRRARRRSTAGQKERLQKGVRRSNKPNKLHALKVGPGKASSLYCFGPRLRRLGSPGTGVKPVRPRQAAAQAARINKHQKLGWVIAALDMQEFVGDPVEEAVCQHWRSISKILARDPSWVSRTWQVLWSRLGDQRRWARVTGPLGAMVAYLKDYGIEAPEWSHWTIPGNTLVGIHVNPDLPWQTFRAEAALRGQISPRCPGSSGPCPW